jgi:Sec-independent protein translocase protein TatA
MAAPRPRETRPMEPQPMLLRTESLFLIVVVGLLLYGWKRLPGSMRDLGKARRILKAESQALRDDVPLPKRRVVDASPEDVVVSRHDG